MRIIDNVLQGVNWLHLTGGMMHRDLKSENILRVNSKREWKICDYGFSTILKRVDN